jgi:hypothetical protein
MEEKSFNIEIRDRLLLYICKALGYCPSQEGLLSLQDFLRNTGNMGDDVKRAASMAIEQIETSLPEEEKNQIRQESVGQISDSGQNIRESDKGGDMPITSFPEEQQIRELLSKGDLFDISAGGVAFFLRISQKKNARLLFGRKVNVTMASTGTSVFTITGHVMAIRSQPVVGNEYSVHVRFSRVLDQIELKSLVDTGKEQP